MVLTHRELQERGHAGKELQDEGLAVQDVELAARELDGLAQLGVALIVGVHLSTWKRTWRHHPMEELLTPLEARLNQLQHCHS